MKKEYIMYATEIHIRIRDLKRGETNDVQLEAGQTIADALVEIGYPWQGHKSWHVWQDGKEIPLSTCLFSDTEVALSHEAMSNVSEFLRYECMGMCT
ncbi:MAG: hypothetical protein KGJ35_00300 [Patescibacteria group bacterium]|nr:hypothetical protein [Patescibacteria group bacterium]